MPVWGKVNNPFQDVQTFSAVAEECRSDYFKAVTVSNITIELAASTHAGIYRYTFPENTAGAVVVNVSHVPQLGTSKDLNYTGGKITIRPDQSYVGFREYDDPESKSKRKRICFCGGFEGTVEGEPHLEGQLSNFLPYLTSL